MNLKRLKSAYPRSLCFSQRNYSWVNRWTKTSGPTNTLFLGSLPYRIMEHDLKEAFSGYGEIKRVAIGA